MILQRYYEKVINKGAVSMGIHDTLADIQRNDDKQLFYFHGPGSEIRIDPLINYLWSLLCVLNYRQFTRDCNAIA